MCSSVRIQDSWNIFHLVLTVEGPRLCDNLEGLSFQNSDWTGKIVNTLGMSVAPPGLLLSVLQLSSLGALWGVKDYIETLAGVSQAVL